MELKKLMQIAKGKFDKNLYQFHFSHFILYVKMIKIKYFPILLFCRSRNVQIWKQYGQPTIGWIL